MANYSLVINSKFKPFSLERYLQPLQLYGQAYREQEDAYADLATKAATVESMANEQTDPESYKAYQNYADALRTQADVLATEGLTPTSRQAMLNMRKRYTQEVVPIQDAYNRRREQAKMQADILKADPTRLFSRMAATTSLDDYRNNKNLDLTLENYSGALLTKQVSDEAAALAKAARNDPNAQTQLRRLLGFNYETIRRTGFDPETVRQAILRSPEANPILTGIVDRVMEGSGIANWTYTSPEEKQRIWNQAVSTASQGLWSAVGQTQYGTVTDDAAKMQAEYNNAVKLAREKYNIEHPNTSNPNNFSSYRTVGNTKVLGDVDAMKKDKDFLAAKMGLGFGVSNKVEQFNITFGHGSVPQYHTIKVNDLQTFRNMASRYGVNLTDKDFKEDGQPKHTAVMAVMNRINKAQDALVQRSNDLIMNTTDDNENLRAILAGNIWSSGNKSWFREEVDGRTKEYMSREDAIAALTSGKDYNVRLSNNKIKIDFTDSGGGPKTVIVDPDAFGVLFDDNTRAALGIRGATSSDLGALLRKREQAISDGNTQLAASYADNIMNALYTLANTRAYTQGTVGDVGTQIKSN